MFRTGVRDRKYGAFVVSGKGCVKRSLEAVMKLILKLLLGKPAGC